MGGGGVGGKGCPDTWDMEDRWVESKVDVVTGPASDPVGESERISVCA